MSWEPVANALRNTLCSTAVRLSGNLGTMLYTVLYADVHIKGESHLFIVNAMVWVTGQLLSVHSFVPLPLNRTHERQKQCLLTHFVEHPLCYIWLDVRVYCETVRGIENGQRRCLCIRSRKPVFHTNAFQSTNNHEINTRTDQFHAVAH
jgi:hypothetical protein